MVFDNGTCVDRDDSVRELSGARILWDVMEREGVDVCFGYPGGAIMPTYDALPDSTIHHVLARHEQGASHMADGYARAGGKVGVAIATSGPGATNLVTGMATAMLDSVPLVCITGQVPSHLLGSDAFQETDVSGITLPVTKHNYLITRTEDIAPALREAFAIARSGRPGPVAVDITKDAQIGTCRYDPLAALVVRSRANAKSPAARDFDRAAALIDGASRPLVLAGQGVIRSGATEALVALAERADLPIATTLLGIGGVPASHPLNLGMPGMHGAAEVNQAIQHADLILAVGMRFDDRVTGNLATFARHAKKIHIDLDPAEINKNVAVDVGLVSDAKAALQGLCDRVRPQQHPAWRSTIAQWRGEAEGRDIVRDDRPDRLHAAHVLHDLWRYTEGDAIVVTDVGQHQMWEAQYYKHDRPRTLLTSGGLGTMGFALPAAIGARFAKPEAEIWVVAGDGGIQMTACELSTCVQEGVKVDIAIINNGYLGMVRQWQEFFFDRRYVATPMTSPDFVKLADAHGLPGQRVTHRDQIAGAVQMARNERRATVIDFRVVEEDTVYPMVPAGNDVADMLRRPHPEET